MNDKTSFAPTRRALLTSSLALGATALAPSLAFCQPQSSRTVKFIIASSPGTGGDTMSRMLQPSLQQKWNQTVIVDNKPGASGIIGIDALAKSPADGSALMIQTSTMFLLPNFYKQIPYDTIKSFQPITQVGWSTFALVVNADVPARNYGELVEWIKSRRGAVNYGTPGKGTENHIFTELLRASAGVEMLHVPYKSTAAAIQDLMGGQVSLMFLPIQTARAQAKGGRIRIIGSTLKDKFPLAPEVPSLYSQGATSFDYSNWYGVWGPAGMAPDLTARYNADLQEALTNSEITARFAEQGWAVKVGTPEALARLSEQQLLQWRELVERTRIELD